MGNLSISTTEKSIQIVRGVVMKGIVMERKTSIQHTDTTSSANKKRNIVLLGADRQWSCHLECFATLQLLRRETSDTLYRSVADCPSFSAEY
ncbi:hypothetical protein TNCV_967611 [Trichonephila clavipes]|nr:hypothetical protein TNCV_967611 [Trichonephila clavipes]